MGFDDAAGRLHYLLSEARRRQLTGIGLKDETELADTLREDNRRTFLL
jgi:ethanolamine ammonia-lyase small subunit